MKLLYDAALVPLRGASYLYGLWPRRTPEATLERDQRMGRRLPSPPPGALWIHGASVGEARIVGALARGVRRLRPALPLVASSVTRTGRAMIPQEPEVDAAFFLPLDFRSVQRRAFEALRPGGVVLVETEIWPNLLAEAAARRVPSCLVNGRLAPERLSRYRLLGALYGPALSHLAAVGAASDAEAARFAALGVKEGALVVTGNVKFDLAAPAVDPAPLRARFGLDARRPVFVAGSTAAGEDPLVLRAFVEVRRAHPGLFLVLAPRHPERVPGMMERIAALGLSAHPLSARDDGKAGRADVLVVDTLGELAALYALGAVSVVGGSLVPVGGHNLLEPVAAGSVVVFGPHVGHVAEVAAALDACGAGHRVADPDALASAIARLIADPDERERRIRAGRDWLVLHRGALARSVELVLATLDGSLR
jgi:3-deoxy-D-manno-octulosonic-acid transferase